jgi:hypothetical protein
MDHLEHGDHGAHAGHPDDAHEHGLPQGPFVVEVRHPVEGPGSDFTRADVVFTGVDHSGSSFEVRIFLNSPEADADTPREAAEGYGGRFHVFGHGGCFGDLGHCDVPPVTGDPTDLRPPHQLTPLSTYVTVTAALRLLVEAREPLVSLTLVPVSCPPRLADARPAPELFLYATVDLRTYLTPLDEPEGRPDTRPPRAVTGGTTRR